MGIFRKSASPLLGKRRSAAPEKVEAGSDANGATTGPTPNPMSNMVLADIALRGGGALLKRAVETGILGQATGAAKAKRVIKGRSMTQTLVGTALARIATRSVPGAIIVGGGMLAKTLYDRRKGRKAALSGQQKLDEQAAKGSDG